MNYRVGQPVWVKFCAENAPPQGGWIAGTILGLSKRFVGKYLVEVPGVPFPYGADFGEGHWCASPVYGLRPRDEPKEQKCEETGDWSQCPWQPETLIVSEEGVNDAKT